MGIPKMAQLIGSCCNTYPNLYRASAGWRTQPCSPLCIGCTCFFRPMWNSDMNYAAVRLLPSERRTETLSRLEAIKGSATDLFQPICLISGDPNPTNWGLLPGGTPVLFDWERLAWAPRRSILQ